LHVVRLQSPHLHHRFAGLLVVTLAAPACQPDPAPVAPTDAASSTATRAAAKPPAQILDELEARIAEGRDREDDRVDAYEAVRGANDDGTADYAFARAALAGRLAELRGAGAGKLVTEAETWARATLDRDPHYRDGAAVRMLGTLYVMAPGRLVEHGDSEDGLSMLEDLAQQRPDDARNHLRVAEAYLHLGDPEPAFPHLCTAMRAASVLRPDERKLLRSLVDDAGGAQGLGCPAQ
jgi:thioredoxin-like negative regulator of GroEL